MIIKFGADKTEYDAWAKNNKVFISRPFFKVVAKNGAGIYMLNSYKFNLLPRFSYIKSTSHLEFGIRWLKINFEFQYNKAFAK